MSILYYTGTSILTGIFLNVQIKNLYPNFMTFKTFNRYVLRFCIFTVPIGLFYQFITIQKRI